MSKSSRNTACRINEHLSAIRSRGADRSIIAKHFNSNTCNMNDFNYFVIEQCPNDKKRRLRETSWIKKLKSFWKE